MSQFGEILALGLQETDDRERGTRTILEFLREKMDGPDRVERPKTLVERLGLKGMGCCGASWGIRPTTATDDEDDDANDPLNPHQTEATRPPPENDSDRDCDAIIPAVSGMNLAAALAEERQLRTAHDPVDGPGMDPSPSPFRLDVTAPETPLRVSLMRLLEETDGVDERVEKEEREKGVGSDSLCCVCMVRKKGAAFIPCGHTYCRVCSRELWLNRGFCPLCNRPILEILDIF